MAKKERPRGRRRGGWGREKKKQLSNRKGSQFAIIFFYFSGTKGKL